MAFTPEQKASIKKRAEELVATEGISTGAAAQKAVKELFSPEEISAAFPVSPAPAPVKPIVEERSPEIIKTDLELEKAERSYRNERKAILEEQGITGEEADKLIAGEIENYRRPAPFGFGDVTERESGLPASYIEKKAEAIGVGPRKTVVAPEPFIGPRIDYNELTNLFKDAYDIPIEDARDRVAIFRSTIIEPRIKAAEEEGLDSYEAIQRALDESLNVLQDIEKRTNDKESYLKEESAIPSDPYMRAFSKQVDLGEGVPNLTEEQQIFLNAVEQSRIEKEVIARKGQTKNIILLPSGQSFPYDPANPPLRLPEGATVVSVEKTPQDIRAEIEKEAPIPWWMDPEKSKKIKADPSSFEEKGLLSTKTPYGTTKETTGGWLLRSAMAPFNALAAIGAGQAYDVFGYGPLAEAREEERAKKGFAGSPILLNIAESRGFMGEAKSAADLAKVKNVGDGVAGPVLYNTVLAGGFAADILDPSLDIAKAVGVAGRSAFRGYRGLGKTYKNLSTGQKLTEAGRNALRLGANDFIDNALGADLFAQGADLITKKGTRFEAGDVRGLIARNLVEDFSTASALAAKGGDDATAAFNALSPSQKSSVFGREYQKKIANAGKDAKVDDVLTIMDDIYTSGSPTKKAIDISTELDAYASGAQRGLKAIRRKDLARSLGSLASVDDEAKALMEGVTGTDKMVKALKDGAPKSYERLKKILLFDEASKEAARAAQGFGAPLENIVAITKNTWAGKAVSKKILERAKESPLGKLALKLNDVELVVAPRSQRQTLDVTGIPTVSQPSVMPAYKLTNEQVDVLSKIVEQLRTYNKLDGSSAATITKMLVDKGQITTENFRNLIDANIDLIAEGLAAEGASGVTRARDLARLPVQEQVEFLVPLEKRTLAREAYKFIQQKLTGNVPVKGNLSVGQKQLVNKAQQDISNLDQKLRKELQAIVKNPEFQKAYGISGPINYQTGLGRLIVGPEPAKDNVKEIIEGILNEMFYSKQTKENAFDILTGTNVQKNTSVFTSFGMDVLRPAIERAADNIIADPNLFWKEVNTVLEEADNVVALGKKAKEEKLSEIEKGIKEKSDIARSEAEAKLQKKLEARKITLEDKIDEIQKRKILEERSIKESYEDRKLSARSKDVVEKLEAKEAKRLKKLEDLTSESIESANKSYEASKLKSEGVAERSIERKTATAEKRAGYEKERFIRKSDTIAYPEKDIINLYEKAGKKIPSEVQVTAYYRTKAKSVAEEALNDLINTEIGKGKLTIVDELDSAAIQGLREQSKKISPDLQNISVAEGVQTQAILNRAKRHLKDEPYGQLTVDDISEIFSVDAEKAAELLKDNEFMEAFQPYFEVAEDVASGIVRRNGLAKTDVDIRKLDDMFKKIIDPQNEQEYKELDLIFGEDVAAQLRDDLAKSYDKAREDILNILDKKYNATGSQQAWNAAETLVDAAQDLRYLLILNTRPRFHGANLLTGAEIVYSTTGRIINPLDLVEGGSVLLNNNPNRIMFRDAAGRAYTSGELNQLLDTTGRSVYSSVKPGASQKAVTNVVERGIPSDGTKLGKIKHVYDLFNRSKLTQAFKDLPQSEDLLFRYAVLKQALQEGRSVDDALALARASMFDLSDVTKYEEYLRRLSLFYGFQRNSLINALNNLGSAKGIKRLLKTKRTRDDLSRFFTTDEEREFAPSYVDSRIILGKSGFDFEKGKHNLIVTPPLQGLDAFYSLAELMKGEITGFVGDSLRPEYKAAFGIDDKFVKELDAVPPEHVFYLKGLTSEPEEIVNFILSGFGAEPTSSYKNKDGITVIPLNTPAQKAAYKKFMTLMSMAGVSTVATDIARMARAKGSKMEKASLGESIAFAGALETPITAFSPEKQAYFDRMSRLAEFNKAIKSMKDTKSEKIKAETPEEEIAKQESIDERKAAIEERKLNVKATKPKSQRNKETIAREIKIAAALARRGVDIRDNLIKIKEGRLELLELRYNIKEINKEEYEKEKANIIKWANSVGI